MIPVGLSDLPIVKASTTISLKYVVALAKVSESEPTIEAMKLEVVAVEVLVSMKTEDEEIKFSKSLIL